MSSTILLAGVPETNATLFHRMRLAVGDSAAFLEHTDGSGQTASLLLVRDIEMERARALGTADEVACAADFSPQAGLSGDRDTALAQAIVEVCRRRGIAEITTDRTLPFLFAWHLQQAGIQLAYDPALGVLARRRKTAEEIELLREAQAATEAGMEWILRTSARAEVEASGRLLHEGELLTSERVRGMIALYFAERGYSTPHDSIVATAPEVGDCHHRGAGPLRTGLPVIVDLFPRNMESRYWGDCTRTVVHGEPSPEVVAMHAAVVAAKAAATAALRAGTTGDAVHRTTIAVMNKHGYPVGPPPSNPPEGWIGMRHGTGHGIGLDVHEPILLADRGEEILSGEVFTVEPGLYSRAFGGVRVEDMIAVNLEGCENLNRLPEGLDWR